LLVLSLLLVSHLADHVQEVGVGLDALGQLTLGLLESALLFLYLTDAELLSLGELAL